MAPALGGMRDQGREQRRKKKQAAIETQSRTQRKKALGWDGTKSSRMDVCTLLQVLRYRTYLFALGILQTVRAFPCGTVLRLGNLLAITAGQTTQKLGSSQCTTCEWTVAASALGHSLLGDGQSARYELGSQDKPRSQ